MDDNAIPVNRENGPVTGLSPADGTEPYVYARLEKKGGMDEGESVVMLGILIKAPVQEYFIHMSHALFPWLNHLIWKVIVTDLLEQGRIDTTPTEIIKSHKSRSGFLIKPLDNPTAESRVLDAVAFGEGQTHTDSGLQGVYELVRSVP